MPNNQIKSLTIDGTTYDIVDETSGFSKVSISRKTTSGTNIADITIDGTTTQLYAPTGGGGSGTVTNVGVSNATDGGLSISGSPVTSSGTITVGHSNVLSSAQTTQAVYPIKIDKNGHISAYGSAVTVPSITLNGSLTTSPSFYAPTSVGTNGYVLKSNGSGTPTWESAASHSHGNITSTGTINSSSSDVDSNDALLIRDASNGNICSTNLTFSSSTGEYAKYLSRGGSWRSLPTVPTKVSDLTNDSGFTTNTGTVTSVGITNGGGLTVSGSPVTSSGNITLTVTGFVPTSNVTTTGEFSKIPQITSSGVLEVGKYIDFHETSATLDYAVRLTAGSASGSGGGTLTAACSEFLLSLIGISDATLISDIASLGWTSDVIV